MPEESILASVSSINIGHKVYRIPLISLLVVHGICEVLGCEKTYISNGVSNADFIECSCIGTLISIINTHEMYMTICALFFTGNFLFLVKVGSAARQNQPQVNNRWVI